MLSKDEINLLPWRETYRRTRYQLFYIIMVASLLTSSIFIYGCYAWFNKKIIAVHNKTHVVKEQIADKQYSYRQIKKIQTDISLYQYLLAQQKLLQTSSQPLINLFNVLKRITPLTIVLTNITSQNEHIMITGQASQQSTLNDMIKQMKKMLPSYHVHLKQFDKNLKGQGLTFQVMLNIM